MESTGKTKFSSNPDASLPVASSALGSKRDFDLRLSPCERWYVVHARPLREVVARDQLVRQGFRVFLPLHMKTVRHARKLSYVKAPVFPRYLFVVLDFERDRWRSINGTSGVSRLVMTEGRPASAPAGVVETLIESADDRGLVRFDDDLKPGQPIRLRTGPFAGAFGVLSRLDARGRVEVLMEILNGDIRLNLARDELEPLRDQSPA